MKPILLSLAIALLMVGCGEPDLSDPDVVEDATADAVDSSKLQDRNGIMYLANEENPFTGRAESFYENGQKELESNYKDGKPDGLWTWWYENGQKKKEGNLKDGKSVGLWTIWKKNEQKWLEINYKDDKEDELYTYWYENGQKESEQNCKDGKLMSAVVWKPNGQKCPVTNVKNGNGVRVVYNADGFKSWERNFKDGKQDRLETGWYRNGQKSEQANYKDRKKDGPATYWYESGQKRKETIWKDGKLMSAVHWKPNGEKCPVTNLKDGNGVGVDYNEDGTELVRRTYKDSLVIRAVYP